MRWAQRPSTTRPRGARAQVALCEHRLGTIAAAAAVVPGEQLGGAAVAAALTEAGGDGGDVGRADAGAGAAAAEAALQRAWEHWERALGPGSALAAEARRRGLPTPGDGLSPS
jgi:hypothetical protein